MIWMGHQEVAGLSPNDTGPTVQWMMISQIHEPLLSLTIQNELEPILAESFEVAMYRSWLTSCRIRSIGKRGARSSGPIG